MAEVRCIVCGTVLEGVQFVLDEEGRLQGYVYTRDDEQKEQEHGTSHTDGAPRGYPCDS